MFHSLDDNPLPFYYIAGGINFLQTKKEIRNFFKILKIFLLSFEKFEDEIYIVFAGEFNLGFSYEEL